MKIQISFCAALFLTNVVIGNYSGDYEYAAFNVLYSGGLFPNIGETKMLNPEFNSVSISGDNTFDTDLVVWEISRNITNEQQTSTGSNLLVNGFSVDIEFIYDPVTGQVQPLPYNVLHATPEAEDTGLSFAFNQTTNVALTLVNNAEEAETETGLGVLIRQSSGNNESSINGRYASFSLESACKNLGQIDRLQLKTTTLEFDGEGNYTESGTESFAEREAGETVVDLGGDLISDTIFTLTNGINAAFSTSGSYYVNDNGSASLVKFQGRSRNAQISSDHNLVVSTSGFLEYQPGGEPGPGIVTGGGAWLNIQVKVRDDFPTDSMDRVYYLGELSEQIQTGSAGFSVAGISTSRTYLHLQPNWNFSIRSDEWLVENRFHNSRFNASTSEPDIKSANLVETKASDKSVWLAQGTYTVETNGILSLSFFNGEYAQAQLSANGEYLAYAEFNNVGDEVETRLGIGIHRIPPEPAAPVNINHLEYTPAGAVVALSIPTNRVVEGLASTNLTTGVWESGGLISSADGTLEITDPDATNTTTRFYTTSFAPW